MWWGVGVRGRETNTYWGQRVTAPITQRWLGAPNSVVDPSDRISVK